MKPQPTRAELVLSSFVPTAVYARESTEFHTRLCLYNYFSELFPEIKTSAKVHMWFFDREGNLAAECTRHIPYRGQLQFDLRELGLEFEGMAAVSLIPETLPEIKPKRVATGYYAYYYDNHGHADFSHEWESLRFIAADSLPWTCVVRPLLTPRTELIVMNAYSGDDLSETKSNWTARLRTAQAEVVAERQMQPLNLRGTVRLPLNDIFPDVAVLAQTHGVLAFEAKGRNIMGPLTYVVTPGGDFNIHHFC